jgi:hypothetical protein
MMLGRFIEATDDCETAIKLNPNVRIYIYMHIIIY